MSSLGNINYYFNNWLDLNSIKCWRNCEWLSMKKGTNCLMWTHFMQMSQCNVSVLKSHLTQPHWQSFSRVNSFMTNHSLECQRYQAPFLSAESLTLRQCIWARIEDKNHFYLFIASFNEPKTMELPPHPTVFLIEVPDTDADIKWALNPFFVPRIYW